MSDCGWMPMMGLGLLFVVLFWALAITGVVYLVKWLTGQGIFGRPESSLDILKKRYARGEISKQEFDVMKQDLQA
ncbi:MAG: SHOCT domain-containing protein [Nitrospirae bacterium]|nr:SHOCT domain-containing protein [Nitrospirota bacterium]